MNETANYEYYSLSTIAKWHITPGEGKVYIPKMQRGLVWDAVRMEILWDSLMRGIPIGTFVLCPAEEQLENQIKQEHETPKGDDLKYLLLDGLQRSNCIAMGYREFPPEEKNDNEKDRSENNSAPILWLDLMPSENINTLRRKFLFKVTTVAHPWGYKCTQEDRENANSCLSSAEQYEAVEKLQKVMTKSGKEFMRHKRPLPGEMWPQEASLPVPVYFLMENNENNVTDFWKKVEENVKKISNVWAMEFNEKISGFVTQNEYEEQREKIFNGIKNIRETRIFAQCAPKDFAKLDSEEDDISKSNISILFERMNVQGVVPSAEELTYSLLKSYWPELSAVDNIAQGKMFPYRMAMLALRVFNSMENKKWVSNVTPVQLRKMAADKDSSGKVNEFIMGKENSSLFQDLCNKVDKWFGLAQEASPDWALLKIHRTSIAQSSIDIYQLLLLLALFDKENKLEPMDMAGLATYLHWFSKEKGQASSIIYECAEKAEGKDIWAGIKTGISQAVDTENLYFPVFPSELEERFNFSPEKGKSYKELVAYEFPYGDALNAIWYGFGHKSGCELLLYATRKFMQEHFDDYDPARRDMWADHNRPWDYDHILPASWLGSRGSLGNGAWMYACRDFLWSIGNSAPIPFSMNRRKKASPPTKDYCDGTQDLLIDYEDIEKYGDEEKYKKLDYNEKEAMFFITTTKKRFLKIYRGWYDTLKIGEIFKIELSKENSERKAAFLKVKNELGSECGVFFLKGRKEYRIRENYDFDWGRSILSVGVPISSKRCFVCISSVGDEWYAGIGKYPQDEWPASDHKEAICKLRNEAEYPAGENQDWYFFTRIKEKGDVIKDDKLEKIITNLKALKREINNK